MTTHQKLRISTPNFVSFNQTNISVSPNWAIVDSDCGARRRKMVTFLQKTFANVDYMRNK